LTKLTPILKLIARSGIDNFLHRGYFVIIHFRSSNSEVLKMTANNVKEPGPEPAATRLVPRTNPTLQGLMRGGDWRLRHPEYYDVILNLFQDNELKKSTHELRSTVNHRDPIAAPNPDMVNF
jgi:hypothetical protein